MSSVDGGQDADTEFKKADVEAMSGMVKSAIIRATK
jgi:hypothetical protein